jgi:hypothetical protein
MGDWMLCNYRGDGSVADYTSSLPFTALVSIAEVADPPQFIERNDALAEAIVSRFGDDAVGLPTSRFLTIRAAAESDVQELYVKLILPPGGPCLLMFMHFHVAFVADVHAFSCGFCGARV